MDPYMTAFRALLAADPRGFDVALGLAVAAMALPPAERRRAAARAVPVVRARLVLGGRRLRRALAPRGRAAA